MKDLIDERNFKEKSARSIVKGYNVHYMTKEEIEAQQLAKQNSMTEQETSGGTVYHQNKFYSTADENTVKRFGNADDSITDEQIQRILGEKEERLHETIESYQEIHENEEV